jgi:hypothetical protein
MATISIQEAYQRSIEDEKFLLEKIKKPDMMFHYVSSFKWVNLDYFLHAFFIENDVQKSKNYLYKVGMVESYSHEILKKEIFNVLNRFTFPILSDSSKLIERYLQYTESDFYDDFNGHFSKGIQSILKNDMPALEKHIDGLKRRSKRGYAKLYTGIITSYNGFANSDSEQIIQGIYEILKTNKRQRPNDLYYQHINYEAAAIAKLAWRKGMEIEIDSPLVPKALLPVKELDHYEGGYDFLNELENN